jgi:hypothetical protein
MEDLLGVGKAVAIDYGAERERRGWVAGHAFVDTTMHSARPMVLVHLAEGFWSDDRSTYVSLFVAHPSNVTALLPDEDVRDPRFMRLARQLRCQPVTAPSAEVAAMGRLRGEALEDEALLEAPGCGGWCAECIREEA